MSHPQAKVSAFGPANEHEHDHENEVAPPMTPTGSISRRHAPSDLLSRSTWRAVVTAATFIALLAAFCICMGASGIQDACATTAEQLEDAKARYAEVEAQLDALAAEYQELSIEQSDTLDAIEQTNNDIAATAAEIEAKKAELVVLKEQLAQIAVHNYMDDEISYVDVIVSSNSFEDFINNINYVQQIANAKQEVIEEVRATQKALQDQQTQLEQQKADLEELNVSLQEQMSAMQAKQAEATELLNSLDAEVKELTEQNNRELFAAAAQEAALTGDISKVMELLGDIGDGSAADVIAACYATPSPGANWCAAWVSNVFLNAGVGGFYGNACDMYSNWCYSSNKDDLQPGMIVAVSSNTCGWAGRIYGHVGIYIGGGMVMENIGYIATTPLDDWISYYGTVVTPRWGWLGGVELY